MKKNADINTYIDRIQIITAHNIIYEQFYEENRGENMTNKITIGKDELVQIEKLEENGAVIYLMKIANIPIRPYITDVEANRVADYMKTIVNAVIQKIDNNKDLTGKDLVDIKSLTIKENISYLLTIADLPLRGYIEGYEALIHKNFMVVIVNEIIRQYSANL